MIDVYHPGRSACTPGPDALRRLADQGRLRLNLHKDVVLLDSYRVLDGLDRMEAGRSPSVTSLLPRDMRVCSPRP